MQASLANVGIGEIRCVRKADLAELRKTKTGASRDVDSAR